MSKKIFQLSNMIKILISNLLILFFLSAHSQNRNQSNFEWVAQYQISFQPDSTNKQRKSENMLLFFNDLSSGFRSVTGYLLDSIKQTPDYLKKSNVERMQVLTKYPTHHEEYIYTEVAKKQITYTTQAKLSPTIHPQYQEHLEFNWIHLNEQKKINNIQCLKAEATIFGRKWIAWYSKEHPAPFGPYKFFGLPGLIVEIRDTNDSYVYSLKSLKKQAIKYSYEDHFTNIQKVDKDRAHALVNQGKYTNVSLSKVEGLSDDFLIKSAKRKEENRKKENNPIELK